MREVNFDQVISRLEAMADPEKIEIKRRKFGIESKNALGIYQRDLKDLAKEIGIDNTLAVSLFDSEIYEARLLCSKIHDPSALTASLMDSWVSTFENWEICDSFCMGFFAKSVHASGKALEWSESEAEFIKRAGFAIMASYGFANKHEANEIFERFLVVVEREADDDRKYVKLSASWALRNIGKRNVDLRNAAMDVAERISRSDSPSAKWIARDALKELRSPNVNVLDYPRATYRLLS